MAQRRMFSKTITNNDNFIDMPDSSQNLYFHLSMNADDDGFVDNWKSIMRMTGHKEDDLKILIAKKYIIPFETGIIVIRHWKIHNYLRSDRYKETIYLEEKSKLNIDKNGVYQEIQPCGIPNGIPVVDAGKDSIGKYNIKENNTISNDIVLKEKKKFVAPSLQEVEEYIKEKNLSVNAKDFYDYFDTGKWKDSEGKQVKNWKQKILTWDKYNKKNNNNQQTKTKYQNYEQRKYDDLSDLYNNFGE